MYKSIRESFESSYRDVDKLYIYVRVDDFFSIWVNGASVKGDLRCHNLMQLLSWVDFSPLHQTDLSDRPKFLKITCTILLTIYNTSPKNSETSELLYMSALCCTNFGLAPNIFLESKSLETRRLGDFGIRMFRKVL